MTLRWGRHSTLYELPHTLQVEHCAPEASAEAALHCKSLDQDPAGSSDPSFA